MTAFGFKRLALGCLKLGRKADLRSKQRVRCDSGEIALDSRSIPATFEKMKWWEWQFSAVPRDSRCVDIAGVASSILATPTIKASGNRGFFAIRLARFE